VPPARAAAITIPVRTRSRPPLSVSKVAALTARVEALEKQLQALHAQH